MSVIGKLEGPARVKIILVIQKEGEAYSFPFDLDVLAGDILRITVCKKRK